MSKTKIAINGFGRIGRLVFRVAAQNENIEVVGINDLIDVDYMAYMLKYDSTHGNFKGEVSVEEGKLIVNGKAIRVTAERNPADLKWGEIGVDYVIESTGLFLSKESRKRPYRGRCQKSSHVCAFLKTIRRCLSWGSTIPITTQLCSLYLTHLVPPTVWHLSPKY